MRVGILTFHCPSNYGAVLQAYGLQSVLQKMGHEACVIDYRPEFLNRPYRAMRRKSLGQWIRLATLHPLTFAYEVIFAVKRMKRNMGFSHFRKQRLNLLPVDEMSRLDAIIVGSDQVWNLEMTEGNTKYFLPDVGGNQLRIAYAASAGQCSMLDKLFDGHIVSLIENFDALSVREASFGSFLRDRISADVATVLDPTLLAGKETFEPLVNSRYIPQEKYLLSFSLTKSEKQEEFAREMALRLEIGRVVSLVGMNELLESRDRICTAKVERFLSLIAGASFIVTSSFHGTAFSILFEKPFLTIGKDETHASRMKSLLDTLDIRSNLLFERDLRATCSKNCGGVLRCISMDYSTVGKLLSMERAKSIQFLGSSLLKRRDDEDRNSDIDAGGKLRRDTSGVGSEDYT